MKKIKVIYPHHASYEKECVEFHVEVDSKTDVNEALEIVWRQANLVTESDVPRMKKYAEEAGVKGIRSMMVGDVCQFDNEFYICDPAGFSKIDKDAVDSLLKSWHNKHLDE